MLDYVILGGLALVILAPFAWLRYLHKLYKAYETFEKQSFPTPDKGLTDVRPDLCDKRKVRIFLWAIAPKLLMTDTCIWYGPELCLAVKDENSYIYVWTEKATQKRRESLVRIIKFAIKIDEESKTISKWYRYSKKLKPKRRWPWQKKRLAVQ